MPELGTLLPSVPVPPPGPRSRALADRLRRVESRNVTWLADDFPVFWSEARGANVRDADGNVYLDLTAAFGVALAGHAHPAVEAAVARQAGRLVHGMGDVHPPAVKVELLERLAELSPWSDARAVLASSGSEAVEIALKTALLTTGRPGILAFEGGYHGLTLGALAATHRTDFRAPFTPRLYPGAAFAPFPHPFRDGPGAADASLEAVRRLLAEGAPGGDPIGAVVVEPIQGRGGIRVPPDGFLPALAWLVRDAGALLVLDEVFTGGGRTGDWLAAEDEALRPDVICMGKTLGAGLPLSACLGPAAVMDAWPASTGEALHTSTFLGHPLGCAAALAFLELVEGGLLERVRSLGEDLRERLEARLARIPVVGEVRGRGLMIGIDLVRPGSRDPLPGGAVEAAALALRRGVLVLPAGERGHVVEVVPPAVLTGAQVEEGVEGLGEVLEALATDRARPGPEGGSGG